MHSLAFVAGATIVVATLWDAFETLVLPRTPGRRARFTWLFNRVSWRLWTACAGRIRSQQQRERFLSVYGPLSVFVLLTSWGAALVLGFALLQWSQREALFNVDGTAHFFDDAYMSATTLFALGLGDVAPKGRGGRLLVVAEIASSLVVLSMLFVYIPILYQSFVRREVRVTMLDARAGSPPTATEILRRLAQSGDVSRLETFFADWERWCAELLESHLSYPAVGYFRSLHPRQSWIAALTAILDVASLVKVGVDGLSPSRAHVTFAIARHAVVDLAQVLAGPAPALADRLPPHELALVRCELESVGLRPNRSRRGDQELIHLRQSYEPYIAALSARLRMPCPSWRAASRDPDNWQTSPVHHHGPLQ